MSTLADMQRDFQRYVLHGDPKIALCVNETERVPAATRLGIYSKAYRGRLIGALASNVTRLQQLTGEHEFADIARQYIESCPSRFRSIRWFGDRLSESLEQSHATQPWLAELARWEWAIAAAFDSRDATAMALSTLLATAPENWPALVFEFHPSAQLLQMKTNAPALFKSLSDDLPLPEPVALDHEQPWLVWRQELKIQYRSLSASEAAALATMHTGGTFETMCDLLCEWHEEDEVPAQAAGMLKGWVLEGLVVGLVAPGSDEVM